MLGRRRTYVTAIETYDHSVAVFDIVHVTHFREAMRDGVEHQKEALHASGLVVVISEKFASSELHEIGDAAICT